MTSRTMKAASLHGNGKFVKVRYCDDGAVVGAEPQPAVEWNFLLNCDTQTISQTSRAELSALHSILLTESSVDETVGLLDLTDINDGDGDTSLLYPIQVLATEPIAFYSRLTWYDYFGRNTESATFLNNSQQSYSTGVTSRVRNETHKVLGHPVDVRTPLLEKAHKMIRTVRYRERVIFQSNGFSLAVHAVPSGAHYGGAVWVIEILDAAVPVFFVVAQGLSHKGDWFIDGVDFKNVHYRARAALLHWPFRGTWTDRQGQAQDEASSCRALINVVLRTMAGGGRCLIPTDGGPGAVKLLLLLLKCFSVASDDFKVLFVHPAGSAPLHFMRSDHSWVSAAVRDRFARTRCSPLDFLSRVGVASSVSGALELAGNMPAIFVSSPATLSAGLSAALFAELCPDPKCRVIIPEAAKEAGPFDFGLSAFFVETFPSLESWVEIFEKEVLSEEDHERLFISEQSRREGVEQQPQEQRPTPEKKETLEAEDVMPPDLLPLNDDVRIQDNVNSLLLASMPGEPKLSDEIPTYGESLQQLRQPAQDMVIKVPAVSATPEASREKSLLKWFGEYPVTLMGRKVVKRKVRCGMYLMPNLFWTSKSVEVADADRVALWLSDAVLPLNAHQLLIMGVDDEMTKHLHSRDVSIAERHVSYVWWEREVMLPTEMHNLIDSPKEIGVAAEDCEIERMRRILSQLKLTGTAAGAATNV